MTKRKVMVFMSILMVDLTKDNGIKVNSMARVYLFPLKEMKEEVHGRTAKG